MNGKPWEGCKKTEDLYVDVDKYFRPIDLKNVTKSVSFLTLNLTFE